MNSRSSLFSSRIAFADKEHCIRRQVLRLVWTRPIWKSRSGIPRTQTSGIEWLIDVWIDWLINYIIIIIYRDKNINTTAFCAIENRIVLYLLCPLFKHNSWWTEWCNKTLWQCCLITTWTFQQNYCKITESKFEILVCEVALLGQFLLSILLEFVLCGSFRLMQDFDVTVN